MSGPQDIDWTLENFINELPVGAELPGELELAAKFNVGRGVLRSALLKLAQLGKISSGQGLARRKLPYLPRPIVWLRIDRYSLTEELKRHNIKPSNDLVQGPREASALELAGITPRLEVEKAFKLLQLTPESKIIWFERIRSGTDLELNITRVLAIEYTLLVKQHIDFTRVTKEILCQPGGLSRIIKSSKLRRPKTLPAVYTTACTEAESKYLGAVTGSPCTCVQTLNQAKDRDGNKCAFEWTVSIYSTAVGLDLGLYKSKKRQKALSDNKKSTE